MTVAALVVSLIAVVIALVSVWFTWRSDRREERSEWREELRDRKAEKEAVAAAEREAMQRRAQLVVRDAGSEGGPTHPMRKLHFTVRNTGMAAASNVALWLSEDTNLPIGISAEIDGLAPGKRSHKMTVEFNAPQYTGKPLNVMLTWSDGDGRKTVVAQTPIV